MMKLMLTRLFLTIFILASLLIAGCSTSKSDTEPDVVEDATMKIKNTDRLYTTEFAVKKIVTYDDVVRLKGKLFGKDISLKVPLPERKIALPMEARFKVYVDFTDFSSDNIVISADDQKSVRVILPDPRIELVSTTADFRNMKEFTGFGRSYFSDAEMQEFQRQGKAVIIASLPRKEIISKARHDAAAVILPIITSMGYDTDNIVIDFRDDIANTNFSDLMIFDIPS